MNADRFLQKFVSSANPDGYVPIQELLSFPRMKVSILVISEQELTELLL